MPVRALSILVVTVTLVGGLVVALMLGMFLRGARRRVQALVLHAAPSQTTAPGASTAPCQAASHVQRPAWHRPL